MPDLGNKLRDKRISLGYTLDDIQERTKIQKRYLESIEDGDFSRLPGSFYVRAFIRQYAEAINLNADELLEEIGPSNKPTYEEPEKKTDKKEENPSLSRIRNEKERLNYKYNKIFDLAPKVLLAISILGIAFCIWKFAPPYFDRNDVDDGQTGQNVDTPQLNVNENIEPADDSQTPDGNTPDQPENPEEPLAEPPADFESALTLVSAEGNLTTYELSGTDQFHLQLTSTGISYIDIKDSTGQIVYAGEVTEGDNPSYDFSAEQSVLVNIGRSTDIKVLINDEEVPYEIAPTEKVHQKIQINFVSTAS